MGQGPAVLRRNAAECRKCGDVIESRHRHDFVWCRCKEIYVDGGLDYIRRGAGDLRNIIDRSEWSDPREAKHER